MKEFIASIPVGFLGFRVGVVGCIITILCLAVLLHDGGAVVTSLTIHPVVRNHHNHNHNHARHQHQHQCRGHGHGRGRGRHNGGVVAMAMNSANNNPNIINNNKEEDELIGGGRYVCLFDNYEKVRGPYFFAMLDQLFELTNQKHKKIAFCTTRKDLENNKNNNNNNNNAAIRIIKSSSDDDSDSDSEGDSDDNIETSAAAVLLLLDELRSSLELDHAPELFVMDDWNPLKLEERFSAVENNGDDDDDEGSPPTIIWLYGNYNAFHTRHLLRTSGFDRFIQEQCASSSSSAPSTPPSPLLSLVDENDGDDDAQDNQEYNNNNNNNSCRLFVGEGTGAICAGSNMDVAHAMGDDPKISPELQINGLQLLGDSNSINNDNNAAGAAFVGIDDEQRPIIQDRYPNIKVCNDDQVFVWAQQPQPTSSAVATRFIMTPSRKGTIEDYATPSPIPPLIILRNKMEEEEEGVACRGEPSIDPSRSAQAEGIGDSEWWE